MSEHEYSVSSSYFAARIDGVTEGRNEDSFAWPHTSPSSAPYLTISSSVDLIIGGDHDPRLSEYDSVCGIGDVKVVPATPTAYDRDFQSPTTYPLELPVADTMVTSSHDVSSNGPYAILESEPGVPPLSIPAYPSAEPPPSHLPDDHPPARVPIARAVPGPNIPSLYTTSIYGHAAPHRLSLPHRILPRPSTHVDTQQDSVPAWIPMAGLPLQTAESSDFPVAAAPPCVWLISEHGAVRYTPHLLSNQLGSHGMPGDFEGDPWLRTMNPVSDPARQYVGDGRKLPSPPPPPPYSGRE